MPLPTFVAAGTVASSAAAITPGMPAGVLAGDILLLFLETAAQAITVSGGTEGWTEITGSPVSSVGTRLTAFYAKASQAAPTSPTTSDSGDHQLGAIVAFRGCEQNLTPWDVTATGTGSPGGSLVTTGNDRMVVIGVACDLPDLTTSGTEFSFSNAGLANVVTTNVNNTTNQGNGGALGVGYGEKAAAGSTGNWTITSVTGGTMRLLTIALQPPVVTTPVARPMGLRLDAVNRAASW